MSDLIIVEKSDLVDIADALREQTDETELMSIKAMPPKIRTLSTGGPTVQADFAQNDETAPDYVKNRTHWIDKTFVELLPETAIDGTYIDLYDVALFDKLSPDAKCTVTLDGVAYETTARHNSYNAYEWYVIGNSDLLGEGGDVDLHLPFGIFVDRYDENWGECSEEFSTVKIDSIGEKVVKIPEIYLPATIGVAGTGSYSEIFNNLTSNIASGDYSRAENFETTASGYAANAQGIQTVAGGYGAHTQGCRTEASGAYSHAEGQYTIASSARSHAEGEGTIAAGENQHVSGTYNIEDDSSLVIVGNGTTEANRSNAYRLAKNGNGYYAGDVFVGSESKKLATEELVNTKPGEIVTGKTFTVDGEEKTAAACAEIYGDLDTNIAIGQWSHAEGSGTRAIGKATHAEGAYSQAITEIGRAHV